jgi:hypothetical protein
MQNEKKTSRNLSDLAFQKGIDKILTRVAFGTHRSMVNQWCEVDFHPWKSNLKLIIALPEQHYNYPSHTRQLCLHIGPMPMEALPFGLGGEATPPHPYKPLGLLVGPLPYRQQTSCLSTKSWGQVDIFP